MNWKFWKKPLDEPYANEVTAAVDMCLAANRRMREETATERPKEDEPHTYSNEVNAMVDMCLMANERRREMAATGKPEGDESGVVIGPDFVVVDGVKYRLTVYQLPEGWRTGRGGRMNYAPERPHAPPAETSVPPSFGEEPVPAHRPYAIQNDGGPLADPHDHWNVCDSLTGLEFPSDAIRDIRGIGDSAREFAKHPIHVLGTPCAGDYDIDDDGETLIKVPEGGGE